MRQIITFPNPILRKKIQQVTEVDGVLFSNIAEMIRLLSESTETAAGLAANQIGFEKRFFGLRVDNNKQIELFINPQIVQTYGSKVYPMVVFSDGKTENFLEGCLSFPDLFGIVKRYLKVKVSWDEIINNKLVNKKKILEGFEAIVFQHEAEHLDGIVFVDHIKEEGGKLYKFEGNKKKLVDVKEIL